MVDALKPKRSEPDPEKTRRDAILIAAGVTWPYIVERRRADSPAVSADLAKSERALRHLQDFFGDDVSALPPPLFDHLVNVAPWTYEWTCWLSDSLHRIEPAKGYDKLRQRLTDPERFMEAWSVLQVAERLQTTGFPVAFDVPLVIEATRKVPDLVFTHPTTETAYICEVSVLFSADAHASQSELLDCIFRLFLFQGDDRVAYAGCIFPDALGEETDGLVNRVAWEIMEVRRERTYREINLENALTMALAPEADSSLVAQWANARGMDFGSLAALRSPIHQWGRLRAKISEKESQLSPDEANLLVIWAQELFIAPDRPDELITIVSKLLPDYLKVSALVLVCEGPSRVFVPSLTLGNIQLHATCRGGIEHQFLIAINEASKHKFPEEVLRNLFRAFSR